MTVPPEQPPAHDPTVQELVTLLDRSNTANAQRTTGVHLSWALAMLGVLAVATFAGFRAYAWSVRRDAADAHTIAAQQAKLDSALAGWRVSDARANRLADSVRIDTELVTHVIEGAPKPVLVPITSPTTGIVSEVPMIPALTFDSLGAACTRLEHDCTAQMAAKDSAMAEIRKALAAADSLTATRVRQLNAAERANFFSKLLWGSAGLAAGRLSCGVR